VSLRRKLIRSIAAGVVFALLLGAALIYANAIAKIDAEMTAALSVGARIARNAVDDEDEIVNAKRRLEILVKDFDGDRHLQAFVIDAAGGVAKSSRLQPSSGSTPEWFYRLFTGRDLGTLVPLPPALATLGRFELRTNSRNEIDEVWGDTLNALAILAVLTLLVSSSVYWIVGSALKPLERLANAFGEVGQSATAAHVPESGPEEFQRVYRAFNSMVDRQARTEAKNRSLNEQILRVQEEERADVARDLHDEIGPFLFNVDVDAAAIARSVEQRDCTAITERVAGIREAVRHMQGHVRGILSRLRPAALLDLGLAEALANLVESWRARQPAVAITFDCDSTTFDPEIEDTVYRIVQESLSNALRHGSPRHVDVSIRLNDSDVGIEVRDDGRGISAARAPGFGISGMRERAAQHGGTVEICAPPDGHGVVVRARLPLSPEREVA